MSTAFSTFFSTIRTEIPTITGFSTKKELENPYDLTLNSNKSLLEGWGVTIGPSTVRSTEFTKVTCDQEVTVVLTASIRGAQTDRSKVTSTVSDLKTDVQRLITRLSANDEFTINAGIIDLHYLNTSAVEYISDDEDNRYLTVSVTFNCIINETLD